MAEPAHIPVMADEVLRQLQPRPGEVAVDCTAGRGGHSVLLAKAVGASGRLIAFDLDPDNLHHTERLVQEIGTPFTGIRASFVTIPQHLRDLDLRADVVLADLGFSSTQMDDPQRGFSFRADGPLDMRFDPDGPSTAANLVNTLPERELADLIFEYGEEPLSRKIARKVVLRRQSEPIQTTAELARTVLEAYGPRARSSRMHPATRTFMALRIAVNDELNALRALLEAITGGAEDVDRRGWLNAGARILVISFHSLEDRLVKRAFVELARRGQAELLTRKPVTATAEELQANVRSRSAKLRAVRMTDPDGN